MYNIITAIYYTVMILPFPKKNICVHFCNYCAIVWGSHCAIEQKMLTITLAQLPLTLTLISIADN